MESVRASPPDFFKVFDMVLQDVDKKLAELRVDETNLAVDGDATRYCIDIFVLYSLAR